MRQYLRFQMPDESVWEVPFAPLMELATRKIVEEGDFTPKQAETFSRDALAGVYHVESLHDEFMVLSWDEVVVLGAKMVTSPKPIPYDQWWRETSAFDFRRTEHEE